MMTDSHAQQKGSDWIDIVWASFENGLVNAEMYNALLLWADVEEQLGDGGMASRYREAAKKLKDTFNRPTTEGGLWDAERQCYVHWRDKDGSVHGTNMVTPVNFMAIAYGICDDPARRAAILDQIEEQMQREKLFIWPLCMSSYQPDEGGGGPFPTYENGDIFLGWGELGTRAYAHYKPAIAVRCVKNVLAPVCQRRPGVSAIPAQNANGRGERHSLEHGQPTRGALPQHLRHSTEMEPSCIWNRISRRNLPARNSTIG